MDFSKSNSTSQLFNQYSNIQFYSFNFAHLVQDNPLEATINQMKKQKIQSSQNGKTHLGDMLRQAVVIKHGGFYMDLNVIVS